MKEEKNWLDWLKVGDEVAVNCGRYSSDDYRITRISKITPSRRFEVEDFRVAVFDSDGVERGVKGPWGTPKRIVPITKEILDKLELRVMIGKINAVKWQTVSAEKLAKILEILN